MGKEFKKKYMHPTRRKLVDMVQTGEYDKNTTIGYDKLEKTRNLGDVWEDEHHKYEKKDGYVVKTGKNSESFHEKIQSFYQFLQHSHLFSHICGVHLPKHHLSYEFFLVYRTRW